MAILTSSTWIEIHSLNNKNHMSWWRRRHQDFRDAELRDIAKKRKKRKKRNHCYWTTMGIIPKVVCVCVCSSHFIWQSHESITSTPAMDKIVEYTGSCQGAEKKLWNQDDDSDTSHYLEHLKWCSKCAFFFFFFKKFDEKLRPSDKNTEKIPKELKRLTVTEISLKNTSSYRWEKLKKNKTVLENRLNQLKIREKIRTIQSTTL